MPDDERLAWLQLARSQGVGPITFFKLIGRFRTARRAVAELPGLIAHWGVGERMRLCPLESVEAELEQLDARGWRLLLHGEEGYTPALAAIADPPPVLTVRGRLELLAGPCVALVGARNASGNGRVLAREWSAALAGAGLVVVSGLARGIDTAAHEGALQAGGGTIAVIASGVDVPYPEENRELHERIAADGAVVSERPLGAIAKARHFPKRNRLIAALSQGVVVVEAAPQSGSLITARLALEQGREVMAVPGSPLDPRHRGTNKLLREGATMVESAEEIVEALRLPVRRLPREPRPVGPEPAAAVGNDGALLDDVLLSRLRERLGPEPLLVDELVRQCDASPAEVQQALLELELGGLVERHPGNRVSRAQA